MDGPTGCKWTVQLGESGRSKSTKVDGPESKWPEVDGPKHESGRYTKMETGWFSKMRGW